ncbi:hypothetical protein Bca4012_019850 [Brassica carinata]
MAVGIGEPIFRASVPRVFDLLEHRGVCVALAIATVAAGAVDTCLLCNVKNGGKIMDMDMLLIDEEFFLYVAELNAESKQRVKWGLTRRITNNNLEAADLDEDGVVGAVEFIVYKLKEMGKIDEKDISGIMEEFEQLDYDDSGTLTTSDIKKKRKITEQLLLRGSLREVTAEDNVNEKRNTNNMDETGSKDPRVPTFVNLLVEVSLM